MAHSKTLTKKCALQICVISEKLQLFTSLWDFASVETQGLRRGPSRNISKRLRVSAGIVEQITTIAQLCSTMQFCINILTLRQCILLQGQLKLKLLIMIMIMLMIMLSVFGWWNGACAGRGSHMFWSAVKIRY